MSMPGQPALGGPTDLGQVLTLDYPQSLAVYDSYAEAQQAVDYLADHDFPVRNLCIVGTDLKTIERVIGRKTWGSVIAQGAMSGVFMGLLVGLMLAIFLPGGLVTMVMAGLVFGIGFGVLNAAVSYAMTRGKRDFDSVRQTVASRYEVLGEHKVAQQARDMLREAPGERARQWNNAGTGVVNAPAGANVPPQTASGPLGAPTHPGVQPRPGGDPEGPAAR